MLRNDNLLIRHDTSSANEKYKILIIKSVVISHELRASDKISSC